MLFRRPWLERAVISVTLASLWFLTSLPVLTSDINRAFSSTELPLAGHFQVPVDQQVVNHSGPRPVWRRETRSTTFKVTWVALLASTFSWSSSLPEGIESLVSILAGHQLTTRSVENTQYLAPSQERKQKTKTQPSPNITAADNAKYFAGYRFTFKSLNKCDKNVKCSDVTAQLCGGNTGKRITEAVLTAHLDGFE